MCLWVFFWESEGSEALASKEVMWDPVSHVSRKEKTHRDRTRLDRFKKKSVEVVNDWHFPMMNDRARNDAFRRTLEAVVTPGSIVLDVGSGGGVLSLLAARLGAKDVFAVEANADIAKVSEEVFRGQSFDTRNIHVINSLSTELKGMPKVDVLVSEILGTFLQGESALEYMSDARDRFLREGGVVVPAGGVQYASVVESQMVRESSRVGVYEGLQLGAFNVFCDTETIIFTKQLGFSLRMSDTTDVSPKFPLYTIDFATDHLSSLPKNAAFTFSVQKDCTLDAIVFHWDVWTDVQRQHNISTHWRAPDANHARDVSWGQAILLLGDANDGSPLTAKHGDTFRVLFTNVHDLAAIKAKVTRL